MKKTQVLDAFRTIQKRFISFLSIAFIIMLGTGGFLMTQYTGRAIQDNATAFYNSQNLKDFELVSSIGINEGDLERIRDVEGVKDAEGVMILDGVLAVRNMSLPVKILSNTQDISVPLLIDGRLPAAEGECMIAEDTASTGYIAVGDKITLTTDTLFGINPLRETHYTVTGIMRHPDYVRSGLIMSVAVPLSSFNREELEGLYTHAFVTAENSDKNDLFSSSYTASVAETRKNIEVMLDSIKGESLDHAKRLALRKIDEKWQEGLEKMNDAERQIEEGEALLEAKLADARGQLEFARAQLNNARAQLERGEALLRDAEAFLAAIHRFRDFMKGLSPREMREFTQTVAGLMDAYDAAEEWQKPEIQNQLRAYVNAPENRLKTEIIREVTGMDLRESAENPASYGSAREVLRQANAVFMLMEAEDNGFSIGEILDTADRLVTKLEAIENAKDEESRAAARRDLAAFLEDPSVQKQLIFMNDYLGISPDALYLIAWSDMPIDGETLHMLHELIRQAKIIRNSILNAESMVARGRAELQTRWAQYYEGLRLFSEKEKEFKEKEAEARARIADARAQLEEKKKEAEAQLADARKQVEELTDTWIIQERSFNAGFNDVKSNTTAAYRAGYAVGTMFLVVSALVCFSTLIIIVDEEKKLVGTTKAFGFTNSEILLKYLIFGGSAAIFGVVSGILMAIGISLFVEKMLTDVKMYLFPVTGIHITWPITLALSFGYILMCSLVTSGACGGLLRSSAYQLINGLISSRKKKAKKAVNLKGSLYSRLVIRNMLNEKARVLINILIVGVGCMIVGVGVSLRLGFMGMTEQQMKAVTVYDARISYDKNVSEESRKLAEEKMKEAGISLLPAVYKTCLFDNRGHLDGLAVVSADPEDIGDYFILRDPKTRKITALPDDGLIVQNRMHESYNIKAGDTMTLYNTRLKISTAPIVGEFINYQGRMALTSLKGYEKIFGEPPVNNCYYVRLNGTGFDELSVLLNSVSDGFSVEAVNYYMNYLKGTIMIYNIIVAISIFIAVVMSFIILTNLASIFINRKKKELIVMRINGFTIKETIDYLKKETILTGAIGLVCGVLLGIIVTPVMIRVLEPADAMFVRSTHWIAWGIAVALEGFFDFVINFTVFQRVRKLNFHDIL